MIRLPDGMRDRLTDAARDNGRSVNAEVVARLEESFQLDLSAIATAQLVEHHEERIAELSAAVDDLQRRMDDVYHMSGWRDYPGNEAR